MTHKHASGGPNRPGGRLAPALSLGLELAVAMLLGVGAGRWADERMASSPVFLLLGTALGFAAGLYLLVRSAKGTASRGD